MKKNNKKGFTLAELLIVVAIIAVLTAIAIPVFNSQLEKARLATDQANIRAAYAEAAVMLMDESAASSLSNQTTGPITWSASVSGDVVTLTTSGSFKSNAYTGKTVTYANGSFSAAGGSTNSTQNP